MLRRICSISFLCCSWSLDSCSDVKSVVAVAGASSASAPLLSAAGTRARTRARKGTSRGWAGSLFMVIYYKRFSLRGQDGRMPSHILAGRGSGCRCRAGKALLSSGKACLPAGKGSHGPKRTAAQRLEFFAVQSGLDGYQQLVHGVDILADRVSRLLERCLLVASQLKLDDRLDALAVQNGRQARVEAL